MGDYRSSSPLVSDSRRRLLGNLDSEHRIKEKASENERLCYFPPFLHNGVDGCQCCMAILVYVASLCRSIWGFRAYWGNNFFRRFLSFFILRFNVWGVIKIREVRDMSNESGKLLFLFHGLSLIGSRSDRSSCACSPILLILLFPSFATSTPMLVPASWFLYAGVQIRT